MKKYVLSMVVCVGMLSGAVAQERGITINSGVLNTHKITNQAIADFGQNSVTLGNIVWDGIENKTHNRFLSGVGAFWVHWGWFWNNHEFGHGTRKTAMGIPSVFKPKYTYNFPRFFVETLIKPVNPSQNNLWASTTGRTSELAYELGADNPYLTYSGTGANRIYTRTKRGLALIAGAGFSNDSQWVEKIGEDIYLQNSVHVSANVSYTLSKILPVLYTSKQGVGDLQEISEATGVSVRAIRTASLLSLALSGSTYSLWKPMLNGERYAHKQKTIKGFRIPDVSAYFTHGISYKINSGYTVSGKTYIPLAFETVTQGDLQKQSELSVGIVHTMSDKMSVQARAIYNLNRKGVSLRSTLSRAINENTDGYISFNHYDIHTMYGERNTPDFRKKKTHSVYVGIKTQF